MPFECQIWTIFPKPDARWWIISSLVIEKSIPPSTKTTNHVNYCPPINLARRVCNKKRSCQTSRWDYWKVNLNSYWFGHRSNTINNTISCGIRQSDQIRSEPDPNQTDSYLLWYIYRRRRRRSFTINFSKQCVYKLTDCRDSGRGREKEFMSCLDVCILTNTLFSVLSPFVSNLTTYLTRIFVCRPSSDFTLSAKEKRKEKDWS